MVVNEETEKLFETDVSCQVSESMLFDYEDIVPAYNLKNTRYFEFDEIEGGKVSNSAENGRGKILFFGSQFCENTKNTLKNIASIDFDDVDIVYLESDYSFTVETIKRLKNNYGNQSDDIEYAYSHDYTTYPYMLEYSSMVHLNIDTFPLIVYIDANNVIQYAESKGTYSAEHVRKIVDVYIHGEEIVTLSSKDIVLESEDSCQLSLLIYNEVQNPQNYTWTSSDISVATVDGNGVVKAVGTGKAVITCQINDNLSVTCTVSIPNMTIIEGLNKWIDGNWYYFKDGVVDKSYTGMAKNEYGWWYMKNGKLDTTYTGMAKNEYGWWYMKNGKLDITYTGMAKNEYGWWYMKNGRTDATYTGMAKNEYGWWYVKNGRPDATYTGMAKNEYGWWYMKNGKLDTTYTGMTKNEYGWWYMKNGKLDTTHTGIARNEYGWWYMKNGKLDTTYTGIAQNEYGWWYVNNGKVDTSYTGTI